MAGLTSGGFVPETYEDIKGRIEAKLDVINPGFDFSPDSPDGQMIGIMTYEIFQAWNELNNVYNSYNPQLAIGAGLRNIGLITGLPYGFAQRSSATLEVTGTAGTIIPVRTFLVDAEGNEFYTTFETTVPANLQVLARVSGVIPVPAGTVTTLQVPIAGVTSITQSTDGVVGSRAQTEQQYKTERLRTVMRNATSIEGNLQGKLIEAGLNQARVINNRTAATLADGTPANSIQVTVGEVGAVTDEQIAKIILTNGSLGCPTYGTTTVNILDSQGVTQSISFSKAAAVVIEVTLDVTYLSTQTAGASANIVKALRQHINSLESGADVVWSRLFAYITPYSQAQINTLTIAASGGTQGITNVVLNDTQFAAIADANITLSVDGVPV